MKPKKALEAIKTPMSVRVKAFQMAFDKKLGRLKLVQESIDKVESMMRENAYDLPRDLPLQGVRYARDEWTSMLEELQGAQKELQAVIVEIGR